MLFPILLVVLLTWEGCYYWILRFNPMLVLLDDKWTMDIWAYKTDLWPFLYRFFAYFSLVSFTWNWNLIKARSFQFIPTRSWIKLSYDLFDKWLIKSFVLVGSSVFIKGCQFLLYTLTWFVLAFYLSKLYQINADYLPNFAEDFCFMSLDEETWENNWRRHWCTHLWWRGAQ